MVRRSGWTGLAALFALTLLTGCTLHSAAETTEPDDVLPGGKVITRADIARNGASNAWEAIERSSTHLLIDHARADRPARVSYRGVDSLVSDRAILLVVDGSAVKNVEGELRAIRAEAILYIQILSGREASLRWGSESANGVIVVKTSAR